MSTASWQQIFEIFERAAELPAGERESFLDRTCDSAEARRAVEELLAADLEQSTAIEPLLASALRATDQPPEGPPQANPQTIGAYRLLRQIGQGGMSTVYLAVRDDDAFRRHVVVKLVRQGMESEAILRRLRVERQILAGLDHPYVARLYDGGSTPEGLPYFAMEYVDGLPIDAYCRHNQLSVPERLVLFSKVCAAVRYAHRNLIVHRDIKPSNILVTAGGTPKLLDFGIAKLLNPSLATAETEPTATWQRVLTPSYASPEQLTGRQITTASDVYSLGVLLYKLLTGRLPRSYEGYSLQQIERLLAETEPEPPSAALGTAGDATESREAPVGLATDQQSVANPAPEDVEEVEGLRGQLTQDLDAITLKALRTAPPRRYGSVGRLVEDIERYTSGRPVAARAGTWRYRAGKFVRRHHKALAIATTIAVLLVGVAGAMALQSVRVARERDQARLERDEKQAVLALILEIVRSSNPYVLPGTTLTVREALERSVPILGEGLHEQPVVRATLLHSSGSLLAAVGVYEPAMDQLEEALAIRRELDDDTDIVETMTALAAVRKELGQLDEAEDLTRRTVELARGISGGSQVSLTAALIETVSVLCYRGDYEAAEAPAREALELLRALPAAAEQEIDVLEYLALVRSSQGDYPEAAALYRQALALRRQRYGEKHPGQIGALSNLGRVLRDQGELDSAIAPYLQVLEIERENFGEDYRHPVSLYSLAGAHFDRGDYFKAQELYREALAAIPESRKPNWRLYFYQLCIERSRLRAGAPAEAEVEIRRLLDLWRPRLGESHARITLGESILGESLSTQGRCQEAEPFLVDSYRRLLQGSKHRYKLDALENLRDHLARCGRSQEIADYEAMLTGSVTVNTAPPSGASS